MCAVFTLAPVGWRDTWRLWQLNRTCFGPNAWSLPEVFLTLVGRTVRLTGCTPEAEMAGFIIGEPHTREGYAWIAALGVHPVYQRQGLGAQLLTAAEAQLTLPRLYLTVRRANRSAIALYEKFGYTQRAVYEQYYAGGEAGLLMEKQR